MKKLAALYFSGTGNTLYAVKKMCQEFSTAGVECERISIEEYEQDKSKLKDADTILLAYPIYGSDCPYIVRDFVQNNKHIFADKSLITLCTQLLFSGDGAAVAARMLKKQYKAHIASIHINMPSNISDLTIFSVKNGDQNAKKLFKAHKKMRTCAQKILSGKKIYNGRHLFSWLLGFFGQRLMWRHLFEKRVKRSLKIQSSACTKCQVCTRCCPTKNISIEGNNIVTHDACTACYRCINKCPQKAISLLSQKKPKTQYKGISD